MGSDFNMRAIPLASEGELRNIGESERYRYYITRLHGVLHFVKAPSEEYSDDLVTLEALRKEFILGYGLNHPSIARYYKFEDNKLYEEYIDGFTLREMIDARDNRLDNPWFITSIAVELLSALEYLHDKEILHLDLKPDNIMITDMGNRLKLIDFNCAANGAIDSTPGFTPEYMAPEQAYGQCDATTDIYAVGKIIEEITADKSFRKKWKKFIDKATSNHPDNRYHSAREATQALDKLHRESQNLRVKYGLIAGLVVFAGLFAWLLTVTFIRNSQTPPQQNISVVQTAETPSETEVVETTGEKDNETIREATPKPVVPPVESEADIERKLTKLIYNKFDEIFSVEAYPIYEKMMQQKTETERYKYDREFTQAYSKGLDQLIEYSEVLSKKYPGQKDFIEERVLRTFETRVSFMREKLHSHAE